MLDHRVFAIDPDWQQTRREPGRQGLDGYTGSCPCTTCPRVNYCAGTGYQCAPFKTWARDGAGTRRKTSR